MEEGKSDPGFPRHFDGKRFYNPDAPQAPGLLEGLRWKLTTRPKSSPRFIADVEPSIPPVAVEGSGLRITLVNHSTVLLQQRGANILTDPIWSERAGPLSWIGPRRRRKPGVSRENLPRIDVVLLSHNHYDHLDLPTLRRSRLAEIRLSLFRLAWHALLRSEKYRTCARVGLGRIIDATRITLGHHDSLRSGYAFLRPGNL